MADFKFWLNAVLSVALIGATVQNTRVMQKQNQAAAKADEGDAVPVDWWRYWPIGAMGVLVLGNVSLLAYERARRPKGPFLRGQLILGMGTGHNSSLLTINGAALTDFKKDYKVAIVCGFNDSSTDKFEDTRISKSEAFSIVPQEMEIFIPHQPPMTDLVNAALANAAQQANAPRPGFRTPPKKRKGKALVHYRTNTWTETILLPKDVDTANIVRLSDVRKLNGKIISEEITEHRLTQTV